MSDLREKVAREMARQVYGVSHADLEQLWQNMDAAYREKYMARARQVLELVEKEKA